MLAELARKLTYFPDRADDLSAGRVGLPPELVHDISLTTDDGLTLRGWHFLADGNAAIDREGANRELSAGRPLALFFSGNGGHRGYRVPEAAILTRAGADVFLFDYRGYGDNPGHPSEESLASDAQAVWRYTTEERRVATPQIVLYGESLGCAVATRLAAELASTGNNPAGIVLRSPFSTLVDVARHHYPLLPVNLFLGDRYASVEWIRQVICPILILHGVNDTIVPCRLGRKLFDAAPVESAGGIPKRFIDLPNGDHNDLLETDADLLQESVTNFIRNVSQKD